MVVDTLPRVAVLRDGIKHNDSDVQLKIAKQKTVRSFYERFFCYFFLRPREGNLRLDEEIERRCIEKYC